MKSVDVISKLLPCILISTVAFAIPPGQWQCVAFDKNESNYSAVGTSPKLAQHAAIARCKKESYNAKTCRTAQSYCEQGPLSLLEDRCIVSDSAGRAWNTTGSNACTTALSLCNNYEYLNGVTRSQCTIKHQ